MMAADNTEKRLKANRELVLILATLVERYPDLRFNQILINYFNVKSDFFYEEPEKTLAIIKKQLKDFKLDI